MKPTTTNLKLTFGFPFQKHENEEDGASGNKDGGGREKKEADVAISFVFGQNIKDRAKVGCFPLSSDLFLTQPLCKPEARTCATNRNIQMVKCSRPERLLHISDSIYTEFLCYSLQFVLNLRLLRTPTLELLSGSQFPR